jgi:hypothetical protein
MVVAITVLLAICVGIIAVAGVAGICGVLADALYLRFGYRFFRQIDAFPREVAFGVIYIPLASSVSALYFGIGVNIVTGGESYGIPLGISFICLGFVLLLVAGKAVARQMRRAGGIIAARADFARINRIALGREAIVTEDVASFIRATRRRIRVGERLIRRGDELGLRLWLSRRRRRSKILSYITTSAAVISALFGVIVILMLVESAAFSGGDIRAIGIGYVITVASSVIALAVTPVLSWRIERKMTRLAGGELQAGGRRAEAILVRIYEQQIRDARPAISKTRSQPGLKFLHRIFRKIS